MVNFMYNFKIFHISLLNKSSESYRPLGNIVFILEAALCISSKHSWAFPLCLYPHLTFSPALCRLRFPVLCFSSVCLCISLPFWKWKKSNAFAKINGIARVLTYIKLSLGRRISSYLAKPFRLALSISPACLHSLRSCLSLRSSSSAGRLQDTMTRRLFQCSVLSLGEKKGREGRSKECV